MKKKKVKRIQIQPQRVKKNDTSEEEDKKEEETELVHRKRTHRIDLNSQRIKPSDVGSMSSADFASSAKILLELDERDRSVRETADARNELESFIFESRNRIYDDQNVQKVSTEEERENFQTILTESEDWIWDVENENAGIYKAKTRELKKIGNPLFLKADEMTARPAAIDAAGKTLGQLLESVDVLYANYSWINKTEIQKLENKTKKAEKWLNEKIEEQEEKSLMETPAFFSYEVYYKIEPLVESAKKLLARPKPYNWGKKKKQKTKNDTNSTETNENVTIETKEDGEDPLTANIDIEQTEKEKEENEQETEQEYETEQDDDANKEDL